MPSPLATHQMTRRPRIVNSFLHDLKKFFLSIPLPSHECAPSQEVSLCWPLPNCKLKNYPSPGQTPYYSKIPNYPTSGCRHLRRHGQGSRYYAFFCNQGSLPPPAAAGRRTDGCALEFFTRASTQGSRDHVTWPAKSPRMLMCVNSPGDGYESAIECEHSFFKNSLIFRVAYSHE